MTRAKRETTIEDTTETTEVVGLPFWQHTIEDGTIPCESEFCLNWAVWLVGTMPPGQWLCTGHAQEAAIEPSWDAMFEAAPDDVPMFDEAASDESEPASR